ncbi:Hypothetical predicted protein, partial [Paramuricea clavata]
MRECAFIRHVRESTKLLDDGRIEVRMPWKPEHTNLPNNRSVAFERMVSKENFGDKPAPDLAINAINLLADRAQVEFSKTARILKDNTHVDDVAGWETSPEKVKKVVDGIHTILGKGKFAIKTWHSNSPEIDQDGNENPVSLLGHQWNKKADSIALKSETVCTDLSYRTKRKDVGVVSQLWDLLGLMAPLTIRFRIDLQNLYEWDK